MLNLQSLSRLLVAATLTLAGAAAAQPVNDACGGAEVLTIPASGSVVNSSATAGIELTASGLEVPTTMSCGGTAQTHSVWYTFVAPTTGSYRVSTCAATNFDTVMQMYRGSCGSLTQVASTCDDDGCGTTYGPSLLTSVSLTAGTTYFVQVAAYDGTTVLSSASRVGIAVNLVVRPLNDRCDGTIPNLALNTPLPFSTNLLTTDDARIGGGSACYVGFGHSSSTLDAPGRDVVFNFTPPSAGSFNVRLGAPSVSNNMILYLTDSCATPTTPPQTYSAPQCIAASNRVGSTVVSQEELVCIPLTGGMPYFVWADETTSSTGGASYELEVTQCLPETEGNDSTATANAVSCPTTGRITPAGDVDFYQLGSNPVGSRVYATVEAIAAGAAGSTSTDFDLRVTSATDTLEYDDNDTDTLFGGSAPSIAGTPLNASGSFLRVSHKSTSTALEPYRIYSVVQTGTPTAEIEPNDSTATANTGTTNYFSGDVTSTSDIDLFAFDARAGDLVFLSLDSQPSRTGSAATGDHTLQLLNLAGTTLVAVNDSNTTVNNAGVTGTLNAVSPAVPSESLVYRIRTTGTYFARVARTAATGTGAYVLSISNGCATGGGIGVPTLTSLSPATGTVSGGTTVVLSGTNFTLSSTVRIGGALATITSQSASSLTVTTPPGSEGAVDVTVTNLGAPTATLTGGFLYFAPIAPPAITSVAPATGPTAGGTVITVNGTLFKAGAEVTLTVGGTTLPATAIVLVNSTQLRATTPAHAAGLAAITVRNPVDAFEGSLAAAFTYLAPPAVSAITPSTGLTTGGQTITLQGSAFRTGAGVFFGATAGTGVVVDPSGTSLTVVTPAAATRGAVNVTVVNADTQQVVVPNGFTYAFPTPTLSAVSPASGFEQGGTVVTITGTFFQAAPTVSVGGAAATSVTRNSLTEIVATTPAGTGIADVVVTNSDGQSATKTGGFTYVAAPVLTAISPASGPVQGGTSITLTGQHFLPGAVVLLGGVPAFAVTVNSSTTATAVTNSNVAGTVDVTIVNPDTQVSTLAGAFTFEGAPALTELSPVSGSTAGGTVVTLTGSGFTAGASVRFGSNLATNVTIVSPTELTAITPASTVGIVSVSIANLDGQSSELARAYRFIAPPTVSGVAPASGDVSGGTAVIITGSDFSTSSTVTFGGVASPQVSLVSATELAAVSPAHAPGSVDLVVANGGASTTLTDGFTYTRGVPTLSMVAPVSGPTAGGTLLTLSGSGFAPGATVTVGGSDATDVVVVSDVLARVVVPAHAAGLVDVVFTNDDAQASTLAGGFTYVAPATNTAGTITDGGDGSLGEGPTGGGGGAGGVSCGCSSFDGSMFSMAGFGLLMVLSRRRRRS